MELITIIHANKIEYIPIIYAFSKRITRNILIYDHATEDKLIATELQKSIKKINDKYGYTQSIEMVEIDEDSKKDMEHIANFFQGDGKELYLNGKGADIALFTVVSSMLLRKNGQVIAYDKEDNSYNLIGQYGFTNEKITDNMKIDDFLILMGEEILEEHALSDIVAKEEELKLLYGDAKRMFKVRFMLKQRKTKELREKYPAIMEALKTLEIIDEQYLLNGQEGFTRFGYMFEWFIYLETRKFDFDDIKVGVKVRFDEKQVKERNLDVSNEFDILVIKNNKIGFIECKIGDPSDPLGTIYKSDSIMEYFGEHSVSLIVNIERDKTPHLKNSKKNFGETLVYRAETKKVNIYNEFDLGKHGFTQKVQHSFDVSLKDEYKKANDKERLDELQDRFNQ